MSPPRLAVSTARLAGLLDPWQAPVRAGGGAPAYRALADRIRALVLDGRLPLATRLPAERALADRLGVSRTTVAAAYDVLRGDGYLHSRRGSGSWTALPGHRTELPTRSLAPTTVSGVIDLGVAAPPGPEPAIGLALAAAAARLPAYTASHGYHPAGIPILREAIAARYTERGAPTTPDQIVVTTGALAGLNLLLRTVLRPGDRVAVDSPTYANAIEAVHTASGRPVPVPLAGDGWDVPAWREALGAAAPRVAYCVPDYQNPTGLLAGDGTRRDLVRLARATGTLLVADETCADLEIDTPPHGRPVPMCAHDRGGTTVVTLGSAAKTFWGGLRIGWIRAAPALARRLVTTRAGVDIAAPVLEQLVTYELITGHEDTVLAERLPRLRLARDVLAAALAEHLPAWSFALPPGGMSLWARTDARSTTALAETALRHGVRIAPGTAFGPAGAFERHVRLPYAHDPATLAEAVRRLADAAADDGPPRPSPGYGDPACLA